MRRLRTPCLVLSIVAAALAAPALTGSAQSAAVPPALFTFSPRNLMPGGTIDVAAWRFQPGVQAVAFSVTDADGHKTTLGVMPIVNGYFVGRFQVPELPPGPYHVGLLDSQLQVVVNLVGTAEVMAPTDAAYGFGPSTALSNSTLTVIGRGFSAPSATVGITTPGGVSSVLGTARIDSDGRLGARFPLPAGLPLGRYYPFVLDAGLRVGFNLTGPMTLVAPVVPDWIPVGLYPIGAVSNPMINRLYVPNGGDNTLSIIDETTRATVNTVPIGGLPCAIGLNAATGRVFVANANTNDVSVVDGATSQVVATVPIAGWGPCGVGVLPALNRAYIANYGSGDVSVIDGSTNTLLRVVPVGFTPVAVAANPTTNRVYAGICFEHVVRVLDGATLQIVATVPVGRCPDAIGVDELRNRIYIGNYLDHTLTVIDGSTNAVLATVPVGAEPSGVAVDPTLDLVYVSNWRSQTLTVLDGSTLDVLADLLSGLTPDGAAVNVITHRAYIVNSISNNVTVLEGGRFR